MPHHIRRAVLAALVAAFLGAAGAVPAPAAGPTAGPTGSISGKVVAPAGLSPARIEVTAYGTGPTLADAYVMTGQDGSYTISGLPDDTYVVVAGPSGPFPAWYAPGVADRASASRLAVHGAPVTGVDIHVQTGALVSGTLVSSSDCDLGRVDVTVIGGPGGRPQVNRYEDRWSAGPLAAPTTYKIRFDGRYAGMDDVVYWPAGDPSDPTSWATLMPGSTISDLAITLRGPTTGCLAPQDYVDQLYLDLLGRAGDPSGVSSWVIAMVHGGATGATVANSFTSSDEFRLGMIDDTYDAYLGRPPDDTGRQFWLQRMRAGVQIEDIEAGFIASDEFYAASGGTAAGWVNALYGLVLERAPAPSEVAWWVDAICRGMNRGAVARGFLYSTEDLTDVVDGYYQWLLGRSIDPVGARDWVALIQHGHRDEEIIAGIVSSDEYRLNVPR